MKRELRDAQMGEFTEEDAPVSLKFSILALLESEELSGYDLAKQFDETFGYFWHATHQQVYRELSKLADDGLVTFRTVEQERRPAKKVYQLTESGKAKLVDWLKTPVKLAKSNDALLVQLFAGEAGNPQLLRQEITRHRSLHEEKLAMFKRFADQTPDPNSTSDRLKHLVLQAGIINEESWLKWASMVEHTLSDICESDSPMN